MNRRGRQGRDYAEEDGSSQPVGRFRLLRYYLWTSLIVIGLVTGAVVFVLLDRAERDFEERSTSRATKEAIHFVEIFYQEIWTSKPQGPGLTLQKVIEPMNLESFFQGITFGLDIVGLNLWDLNGRVLWSSSPSPLPTQTLDADTVSTVVKRGISLSALLESQTIVDIQGEEQQLDVVATFSPLRDVTLSAPLEGRVVGVLEMYQDVTADFAAARSDSLRFALVGSLDMGALLFTVLFLTVFRADRVIGRGYARQNRQQELVRESAQSLRTVVTCAPIVLYTMDCDGVITLSEGKGLDALGLKPGQLVGQTVSEAYRDEPVVLHDNRRALSGETFSSVVELGDLAFETFYAALPGEHGKVEGVISVGVDVTDRVQAERALRDTNRELQEALEEIRQTQEQLVRQERLRALGEMASGIAHDFNNALGPILGYSDILLAYPETLDDKSLTAEYLRTMNTSAKDAAAVVNRLSEFYRQREGAELLQPVDLNRVVKESVSLSQPRWKDMAQAEGVGIDIRTDLASDLPSIEGDESNLRTALTNLIFNAVDAMPKGGALTITTHRLEEWAVVAVADTGTGMTEEVRRRALEPFFTTKGQRGTGLGLAMVYGIVQRHEGVIDIESEIGRGSTVTIRLPVGSQRPQAAEKPRKADARSLHVLVAEDEPEMQRLFARYLQKDGHTVDVAADGQKALQKFQSGGFDLVITDRGMPNLSGDQVAAAIRVAGDTPVIMVTGFGGMMAASGDRPYGVDFTLSKPVGIAALRHAVSSVVKG